MGHRAVLAVAAALCVLSTTACTTPSDELGDGTRLDAVLDELVERADGPLGVVVTIDDGSTTRVHTAGRAASGSSDEPGAGHHMRIASLSKALTGATALSLVDSGDLSLDDTIGDWLPDLPDAWHPVTLRQLLGHTSGVPDFGASPEFGEAVGESLTAAPPPEEILAMAGTGTDFAPGERYEYSNSNPFVTALIIEAATGQQFADVLAERVLDPLEMDDTHLPARDDPELPDPTLRGYDVALDGSVEDVTEAVSFGGWAWASGGVVSTPEYLGRFVRGYLGGDLFGDVVARAQRRFVDPGDSSPPGPGDNSAGLALFRYRTRCGTVYGHTGSILGYTQFMAASADGTRSVTFSISTQASDDLVEELRKAQVLAVCEALR